jgi:hypothetical protein
LDKFCQKHPGKEKFAVYPGLKRIAGKQQLLIEQGGWSENG